jgi:hypothetical protein
VLILPLDTIQRPGKTHEVNPKERKAAARAKDGEAARVALRRFAEALKLKSVLA